MQKIKATFDNGSFVSITWKRQSNNLYSTSSNFYDADGYYRADLSYTQTDRPYDIILNGIEAAKRLFKKVETF